MVAEPPGAVAPMADETAQSPSQELVRTSGEIGPARYGSRAPAETGMHAKAGASRTPSLKTARLNSMAVLGNG